MFCVVEKGTSSLSALISYNARHKSHSHDTKVILITEDVLDANASQTFCGASPVPVFCVVEKGTLSLSVTLTYFSTIKKTIITKHVLDANASQTVCGASPVPVVYVVEKKVVIKDHYTTHPTYYKKLLLTKCFAFRECLSALRATI